MDWNGSQCTEVQPKGVSLRFLFPKNTVAQCQPTRLASMIRQFTAPQGQDEPDRNQEHNHPALATAPLRLQPATSRP
jgi:hypothetical protein